MWCEPKAMFPQTLNLPAHFPPRFADGGSSSRVQAGGGGLCTNGTPILREESSGQLVCGCQLPTHSSSALHPHHPHLHLPPHHASLASAPHPHPSLPTSSSHPHVLPVQVPLPAFTAARGVGGSDPVTGAGIGVAKDLLSTRTIPLGGPYTAAAFAAYHPYLYSGYDLGIRKTAVRETTQPLKSWLHEHRKNPYPTKAEKIMLAIITQMTLTQVSTWFANARRRLKKEGGGGHWESVSDGGDTTGSQAEDPSSHKDGSSQGDHYEDLSDESGAEDVNDEGVSSSPLPHYHPPHHPAFTPSSCYPSSPPDPLHHYHHHSQASPEYQLSRPGSPHPRVLRPSVLHPTPLLAYPSPSTTTTTTTTTTTMHQHLLPVHPGLSLLSSPPSKVSAVEASSAFTTAESSITAGDLGAGTSLPRSVSGNVAVVSAPAVVTSMHQQQTGGSSEKVGSGSATANSGGSNSSSSSKSKPRIWSISSIMGFGDDEEEGDREMEKGERRSLGGEGAGRDSVGVLNLSSNSSCERSSSSGVGAPRVSVSPKERGSSSSGGGDTSGMTGSPPCDGGSFSDYSGSLSGVEQGSPHRGRETRVDCDHATETKERRRDDGVKHADSGEKVRRVDGENGRDVNELRGINAKELAAKDLNNERQRDRSPKKNSADKKTTGGKKDMDKNYHGRSVGDEGHQREPWREQN